MNPKTQHNQHKLIPADPDAATQIGGELAKMVKAKFGSQTRAAAHWGISQAFLSRVICGGRVMPGWLGDLLDQHLQDQTAAPGPEKIDYLAHLRERERELGRQLEVTQVAIGEYISYHGIQEARHE